MMSSWYLLQRCSWEDPFLQFQKNLESSHSCLSSKPPGKDIQSKLQFVSRDERREIIEKE